MEKLKKYIEKRDFSKTNEPKGEKKTKTQKNIFAVQHHLASRDHFDFRLQWHGVLLSFAVPKGPSFNPKDKRLAVHVEDHPLEYADFEGTIPQGEYGGGTVMLWDIGTFKPNENFEKGWKKGSLKFTLFGQRLKGKWALVRLKNDEENWLLIKEVDEFAQDQDGISRFETSIKTGRTMEEIRQKNKEKLLNNTSADKEKSQNVQKLKKDAKKSEKNTEKVPKTTKTGEKNKKNPFKTIDAQLCTLSNEIPKEDFVFEVKYDGYRIVAFAEEGNVQLFTRNHTDFSQKFEGIAEEIKSLCDGRSLVLDGEIIMPDEKGRPDFQALQNHMRSGKTSVAIYMIFDILALDGKDLRKCPLLERKKILQQVLEENDSPNLKFAEHFEGDGKKFFKAVEKMGLEGIVAKRKNSKYLGERNEDWLKIKCYKRQEFVIGGFLQSNKKTLSALVLGFFEGKKLKFVGKCGTGFDHQETEVLLEKFEKLKTLKSPFCETNIEELVTKKSMWTAIREKESGMSECKIFWLRPQLVAEIQFAEITKDGILRQASFKGLRQDKDAKEVVLEIENSNKAKKSVESVKKTVKIAKKTAKNVKKTKKNDVFSICGIEISHPDKIIFKNPKITKKEVAQYYEQISSRMFPLLRGRILSVVRCHNSLLQGFYKKHPTAERNGIKKVIIENEEGKKQEYFSLENISGLLEQVQLGTLEFHMWGSHCKTLEKPDFMVFDLDPDKGLGLEKVRQGVKDLKKVLDGLGLVSFLKTSGGKGYHVCVPFKPKADWKTFHDFSEKIAHLLENKFPERYTTNIRKNTRKGKIFIDFMRNTRTATSVAPYSLRARVGAKVSCPISWSELDKIAPDDIDMHEALIRLKKVDPWKNFDKIEQSLN